jgi:hypothetical protein
MEVAEADSPSTPLRQAPAVDAECARSLPRIGTNLEEDRMDGELSSERAAENQSLYRSINESVNDLNQTFAEVTVTPFSGEWICECADTHCMLRIKATLQEYETVRANGRTFLVCPGHVYPEVERVVAENDRFATVEKLSDAGQIAESLDPRHMDDA